MTCSERDLPGVGDGEDRHLRSDNAALAAPGSAHQIARLAGDDARDVIAVVEAVERQDYSGMSVILHTADQLGLTVGLAVLSAHLLRELHGDKASYWLAEHRRAALALDWT
jgi:hypothetical protein